MDDRLLLALVALAGALIGGLLQAWSNRRVERGRFFRENKREMYGSFLTSLATLSIYSEGAPEILTAKMSMAEARCRIGLYSSPEVIQLVARIFEQNDLTTAKGQADLSRAVAAMRRDVGLRGGQALESDLMSLIFTTPADAPPKST